jgi:hypothetical protein
VQNHIDNQLILKILSDKFDLNNYDDKEKEWRENAFDSICFFDR